eukprot:365966-Chlamydomonas_euryale.AAC.12
MNARAAGPELPCADLGHPCVWCADDSHRRSYAAGPDCVGRVDGRHGEYCPLPKYGQCHCTPCFAREMQRRWEPSYLSILITYLIKWDQSKHLACNALHDQPTSWIPLKDPCPAPTVQVTVTDALGGVATVETADIMVNGGMSVIHTISAVLLPPGLGK